MTAAPTACASSRGAPGRPIRTLLVDDVAELRLLYRTMLELDGRFEVVGEAGDGDTAVERARTLQPRLVTLDVSMPGRDGMEALPDIRRVAPEAAVVMLTGFEAWRLEPLARRSGAADFIEKGAPPEELVARLLRAVGVEDLEIPTAPSAGQASSGRSSADEEMSVDERMAVLAHDLRSPLAVVRGFAEALMSGLGSLPDGLTREMAEGIASNAAHLDGVVDAVLAQHRGGSALDLVEVDLGDALGRIVEAVRREHPQRTVRLQLPGVRLRARVDEVALRRVLSNLVGNALRHGAVDVVEVELHSGSGLAEVVVRDRGRGIPADERERVFERWVHLEEGRGGLGLGLFVTRTLVEAMDGRIRITDAEPGTAVHVVLPAR